MSKIPCNVYRQWYKQTGACVLKRRTVQINTLINNLRLTFILHNLYNNCLLVSLLMKPNFHINLHNPSYTFTNFWRLFLMMRRSFLMMRRLLRVIPRLGKNMGRLPIRKSMKNEGLWRIMNVWDRFSVCKEQIIRQLLQNMKDERQKWQNHFNVKARW